MKTQSITPSLLSHFQAIVWDYYRHNGRSFMWRHVDDPYKIVVSEIMLQQTQTNRVTEKYEQFITTFSGFESLANASLRDVLSVWQGLGYNRRGMYLHQISQKVLTEHAGNLPDDPDVLITFPGIGKATASSICAFAFNKPTIFIETNIRAVFIHFFFANEQNIHDKDIMPLVAATVDRESPRDWYYALMDYGVMLKKSVVNPSRKSAHHAKQSKFEGSDRQIRGMIIRALTEQPIMKERELIVLLQKDKTRTKKIIEQLCSDGLLTKQGTLLRIA